MHVEIFTGCLPVTQGKHNIAVQPCDIGHGKRDNNRIGQI